MTRQGRDRFEAFFLIVAVTLFLASCAGGTIGTGIYGKPGGGPGSTWGPRGASVAKQKVRYVTLSGVVSRKDGGPVSAMKVFAKGARTNEESITDPSGTFEILLVLTEEAVGLPIEFRFEDRLGVSWKTELSGPFSQKGVTRFVLGSAGNVLAVERRQ